MGQKIFFDTEFHEYEKDGTPTIDLISIGLVAEDGRELYLISADFDVEAAWDNPWLRENVLQGLYSPCERHEELENLLARDAFGRKAIARKVTEFVGENPEFYAYYADYDWVVFCWLFGRMIDLPKGFPMYCRDLKQTLDETAVRAECAIENIKADPAYPTQENEHNALDDAKWNLALYKFLTELYQ